MITDINVVELPYEILVESIENGSAVESWECVDCGVNTAPGCLGLEDTVKAVNYHCVVMGEHSIQERFTPDSEMYMVHRRVWKKAGMGSWDGCLCVGCLEQRIGRELTPKDFDREHPFNYPEYACTERLRSRRDKDVWRNRQNKLKEERRK
jgi:hypothetical protein